MATTVERPHYQLTFWLGEFADADLEHRFRARVAPAVRKRLSKFFLVWAALLLLFGIHDYHTFGLSGTFLILTTARCAAVALLLACAAHLRQTAGGIPAWPLAAVLMPVTVAFVATLSFLMSTDNLPWTTTIFMAALLGTFIVLPERLGTGTLVSIAAIAVYMVCTYLVVPETTPARMTVFGMILALPAGVGFIAAHRIQIASREAFAALEHAERELSRRKQLETELRRTAATDPLTGVFNRRHYLPLFQREFERALRYRQPLALCLLDLDHFKRINDTYGHAAGDTALRTIADICRSELRETDVLGRLGGEEFVVLLPNTTAENAKAAAERIRARLAATEIVEGGQRFRVSTTIGVTELRPGDRQIDDLIQRADHALYAGKEAGRNRVQLT